jgi:hypothetical protein
MSQAPALQFEWWDHIFILHALKVGLAGVLALFFVEALRLQFPQWSLFTVMVLVSPTIDWVRLPQRIPVRIQVDGSAPIELRVGQTVSLAISHGLQAAAFLNRLTSIGFGRFPTHSDR